MGEWFCTTTPLTARIPLQLLVPLRKLVESKSHHRIYGQVSFETSAPQLRWRLLLSLFAGEKCSQGILLGAKETLFKYAAWPEACERH